MDQANTQDPVDDADDVQAAAGTTVFFTKHDDGSLEIEVPDAGTADPRVAAVAQVAELSPIDASMRRGNPRQRAIPPSLFDQPQPLALPPVGMHPDNVTSHPLYTEDDATVCSPAVAALQAMHDMAGRVIEAREQLRNNIALSQGQQVSEVAGLYDKLSKAALLKADTALKSLTSSIRSLESELAAPVQAAAHNPVAQEVRSYLRSLPEGKRLGVVMEAVNAGCVTTAGAVLAQGLPAYLTGLSADTLPVLQKTWNTKRNPQAAQRLELLRAVWDKVNAAGTQTFQLGERLVGATQQTQKRLREAQTQYRKVTGAIA